MTYDSNLSTPEAEAEGPRAQSQPGLHRVWPYSWLHRETPAPKQIKHTEKRWFQHEVRKMDHNKNVCGKLCWDQYFCKVARLCMYECVRCVSVCMCVRVCVWDVFECVHVIVYMWYVVCGMFVCMCVCVWYDWGWYVITCVCRSQKKALGACCRKPLVYHSETVLFANLVGPIAWAYC